jgi:prevent-host-death family protein
VKILNIHEAKTHLSKLVEEAVAGESIVVAKAGKPMVQLVPVGSARAPRPLGQLAGQVTEAPDCSAEDEQIQEWFYGVVHEPAPKVAE